MERIMASLVLFWRKKFSMDGPEGWRREFTSGGRSVMVGTAFGYNNKYSVAFVRGNMDSIRYVYLVQESCWPYLQACALNPVVRWYTTHISRRADEHTHREANPKMCNIWDGNILCSFVWLGVTFVSTVSFQNKHFLQLRGIFKIRSISKSPQRI
jgi:hypothetical protein